MAISEREAIQYMQLYKLRLQGSVGDLKTDIEAFDKAIEALEHLEKDKKNKAWREHWADRGY